jgi:hypothetical protein
VFNSYHYPFFTRFCPFFIDKRSIYGYDIFSHSDPARAAFLYTAKTIWPHRLSVRTLGFHPKKRGPTPLGATKKIKHRFFIAGVLFFPNLEIK